MLEAGQRDFPSDSAAADVVIALDDENTQSVFRQQCAARESVMAPAGDEDVVICHRQNLSVMRVNGRLRAELL